MSIAKIDSQNTKTKNLKCKIKNKFRNKIEHLLKKKKKQSLINNNNQPLTLNDQWIENFH